MRAAHFILTSRLQKLDDQGVRSFLLQQLLNSDHVPLGSFLIAWPMPEVASQGTSDHEHEQAKSADTAFFTKVTSFTEPLCDYMRPLIDYMHDFSKDSVASVVHASSHTQRIRATLLALLSLCTTNLLERAVGRLSALAS